MIYKPYQTTFTDQIKDLKPTNALEYKLMLDIALMLINKINEDFDKVLNDKNNTN